MALTETGIRSLKSKEKPFKLGDAGGLYMLANPNGSRLWRMKYRWHGREKTLSIGEYPAVTLAKAREARDAAKRLLANGVDPNVEKRKIAASATENVENTFSKIVDEWLAKQEDSASKKTIEKNTWLLKKLAGPELGHRPIADITPAEVLNVLQHVERTGRHESARRLRQIMSVVFRYAIVTLRCQTDPSQPLIGATKAPVVKSHAAIVDEREFGKLLNNVDAHDGWPTLRCAMQFTALVACRPQEVRCAEWRYVDLENRKWTVPVGLMKSRKEDHEVPLSDQAIEVLNDVWRISGGRSKYVFPQIRSFDRPLSENAINSALRRMGYTDTEHTAHGFRSSFSTILNKRKFDAGIIEDALSHTDSSVRRIYNRHKAWEERVKLMQSWADLCDGLRAKARPSVTPLVDEFADLLG
jgi:integrase